MSDQNTTIAANIKTPFYYGYVIVIASFIIIMITAGNFFSFGVFFKPMLNDFGWSRAVTSGPISMTGLIAGLVTIMMGSVTDKFGPRRVVISCCFLSGIGYILMWQLSNIWQLYLYYGILIGCGNAVMVPLVSTVARWFDQRRTVMTGIVMAGAGVGGLVIPLVANWLISNYTWRTSYIILGVADIVIITAAALFLKRSPTREVASSIVMNKIKIRGIPQETSGYSFKQSFTTRHFWLMLILFFCFGITVGTIQLHIVPHATDINISSIAAAGILSTISGVGIAGSIGLGSLADRIGNKWLFIMTFIIEAVALLWLLFTQQLWGLYLFAVVYGLAYGSGLAQQSPFTAKIFGMHSHGAILGVLNLSQTVAGGVGGILAGYIFDVAGNYQLMFVIVAIFCLVGLFATVLVKPLKDSNKEMVME